MFGFLKRKIQGKGMLTVGDVERKALKHVVSIILGQKKILSVCEGLRILYGKTRKFNFSLKIYKKENKSYCDLRIDEKPYFWFFRKEDGNIDILGQYISDEQYEAIYKVMLKVKEKTEDMNSLSRIKKIVKFLG